MISSPSAQIVNAVSEKTFVRDEGGPHVKAYGPVMGVATAIIAIGITITVALGPERIGRRFDADPIVGVHDSSSKIDEESQLGDEKTSRRDTMEEDVVSGQREKV